VHSSDILILKLILILVFILFFSRSYYIFYFSDSLQNTHPFNGPLSGTTRVSRYQKGKTNVDFTEARVSYGELRSSIRWKSSGSGIHWAICKCAPHCRQITMPAPHHSVFYRPDALPVAQPTASKHWRQLTLYNTSAKNHKMRKILDKFSPCLFGRVIKWLRAVSRLVRSLESWADDFHPITSCPPHLSWRNLRT